MQDARRNQVEDDFRPPDINRMPGVMAALVAGDDVKGGRQEIDDLAFAFIPPLGAEDDDIGLVALPSS
jgi:hypothetical protein